MSEARISPKAYLAVFLGLWSFTALTVAAAYVDLGPLSTPVAMAIAIVKALLVLAFFMHLKLSNRLVWIFASAGFLWLALLIGFTVVEVRTRGNDTIGGPFTHPAVFPSPSMGGSPLTPAAAGEDEPDAPSSTPGSLDRRQSPSHLPR